MEDVQPAAIGEGGFGQDDIVFALPKLGCADCKRFHMLHLKRQRVQHFNEVPGIVRASGDKQNSGPHSAHSYMKLP